MFKDLVEALFRELDEALPDSFDRTIIVAHQREGAMIVMDTIFKWEPDSVAEAKNKAATQGKPVEDEE